MMGRTKKIEIKTHEHQTFYDVTPEVQKVVEESGVEEGIATVFTTHTTSSIKVLEDESLLKNDVKNFLARLAPKESLYYHDEINKREVPDHERINAYSHLRSLILPTCETIPIVGKKLALGQWQKINMIENDPGRDRQVVILVMGDKQ